MNYVIKNIVILVLIFSVFACEEPTPIEIENLNEENGEVSAVQTDPEFQIISGYDSTGIIDERPASSSLISISGIKNTLGNTTIYKGYGEAIFLDINKPVSTLDNRLIGYKTLNFRTVKFNDQSAKVEPLRIRYRENSAIKDTLLGFKNTISYRRVLSPENHDFPYNNNMKIVIADQGMRVDELNIKLPQEIIGKIELTDNKLKRNQNILLSWNNKNSQNQLNGDFSVEIIVGGISKFDQELIPLMRLRRMISNKFELKNSLLREIISSDKFEYFVFTFIRKIHRSHSTSNLGNIHFASQSIHNIWVKI